MSLYLSLFLALSLCLSRARSLSHTEVKHVRTKAEFDELVSSSGKQLLVVDFTVPQNYSIAQN